MLEFLFTGPHADDAQPGRKRWNCCIDDVDALARQGARIKEAEPKLDTTQLHEMYILLLRAATSARASDEDIERWRMAAEAISPGKEPYLDLMVRGSTLSHRDWLRLNNDRHGLRRTFVAFFEEYDVLLCPVGASAATPHDHAGERWQRRINVNGKSVPEKRSVLGRLFEPRLSACDGRPGGDHRGGAAGRLPGNSSKRSRQDRDRIEPRHRKGNRWLRSATGL